MFADSSAATVVATFVVGMAAGVTAGAEVEANRPEVEALLRAIGFGPYGLVMVWIALTIRRAFTTACDTVLHKLDVVLTATHAKTEALMDLTAAIREAIGARREPTPYRKPARAEGNGRRPKTDPVAALEHRQRFDPADPDHR